jgi:hypothetical protein
MYGEWTGEWSSLDEYWMQKAEKTRTDFDDWLAKRKKNHDEVLDRYLAKRRRGNGRSPRTHKV